MHKRPDPIVPVLGSVVALVVVGAIGLVFVPRVSRWLGPAEDSVVARMPSPTATVPVWVCRSVDGVALLLEEILSEASSEVLDHAFSGGRYHYLRLQVCNFGRGGPFALEIPATGLTSPEGGAPALPASMQLRPEAAARLGAILRGLGAVDRLEVAQGHRGQALLLLADDPATRTAFAAGPLVFERREVERRILAAWDQEPDWKRFQDF